MGRYLPVALVCLLAAPTAAAAQIVRTFDVESGGRLVLAAEQGSLEIRTGAIDAIRVEIRRGDDAAEDILEDFDVTFAVDGSDVRLDVDSLRDRRGFFERRERLELVVDVPPVFNLDLRTSGGAVTIGSLRGDVRARTSGGRVRIGAIDGPVWARTSGGGVSVDAATELDISSSGGSLRVGEVTGMVTARSSGGGITIARARAVDASTSGGGITIEQVTEWADARTSGGGIRVAFDASPLRDSSLATSGGGITVIVPPTATFTLDARGSGARSDLPLSGSSGRRNRGRLEGDVNGGGPVLQLRSSGGGVVIESR
jgi:hypothetical protein